MAPIFDIIQSIRTLIAGAQEIPDDECVACESRDLTSLAEGVYRCNMCGYEGGSGYAAWQQKQRDDEMLALPPERRKELARQKLEQALVLLSSADGDAGAGYVHNGNALLGAAGALGDAIQMVDSDGYVGTDGDAQQQTNAERDVMEAEEPTDDALVLLYGVRDDPATPEEPGYVSSFMQMRLDHHLGDVGHMARNVSIKGKIRALRPVIERTLAEAFD